MQQPGKLWREERTMLMNRKNTNKYNELYRNGIHCCPSRENLYFFTQVKIH